MNRLGDKWCDKKTEGDETSVGFPENRNAIGKICEASLIGLE